MPDPSGDLPSPPAKQSGAQRPAGTPESPAPLAPAPRLHPPSAHHPRNAPKPPSTNLPPPGLSEVLSWMKQHGHIEDTSVDGLDGAPSDAQSLRAQLPKDQRKFHKFDPEHPVPYRIAAGETQIEQSNPDAWDDQPLAGADPLHRLSPEQLFRLRQSQRGVTEYGLWISVGVGVCVFLLVAATFLLTHTNLYGFFTPARAAADALQTSVGDGHHRPTELPAAVLGLIDEATIAETAKDYAKAIDRLEHAKLDGIHVYGLDYHLAALYIKADDSAHALPLLNHSIIEGEQVAACCNLRGNLAAQKNASDQSLADLEKATQIDPFNARYFFDWGEALRHTGAFRLALEQLKRGVDRLQEPALLPQYALKIRLTELELGLGDAFTAELDSRLKQNPPPAEWLLTAAAVEMRRSDFSAAAEYLVQLRALIGEHETMKQLQDTYFGRFSREKALENFFEGTALPVNVTPP